MPVPMPVGAQAAAPVAVIIGMKQLLAFACLVAGVISAVLVGPLETGRQAPAPPDRPGLDRDAVTFGPDAPSWAPPAPAPAWGTLPMPQPETLVASQRPPTATRLGQASTPLARLQAMPASTQPTAFQPDRTGALASAGPLVEPADVPEPESWLMLVAGFGLVGLGARRRHLATL